MLWNDFLKSRKITTFADVQRSHGGLYPGFLFLRHALAITILLHHARILTRGPHDGSTGVVIGGDGATMASILFSQDALRPFLYSLVGAFFALSGFLVAGSALRNRSVKDFLLLRVFRLLPALTTEIMLSAFILGPIVTEFTLSAYFTDHNLYEYFGNLVGFVQFDLPGVFIHNPFPDRVNESLWTLEPELACYGLMALVMAPGLLFNRRRFGIIMLIVTAVLAIVAFTGLADINTRLDLTRFSHWFIVYLFFVGVVFKLFDEFLPVSLPLFVVCGVSYFFLLLTNGSDVMAGLCLVYCTAYVGALRFGWFDRICRWDISYGLYLYGFPISQTLIHFLVPHYLGQDAKGVVVIMALSLFLTVCFASASWLLIEKPALKLKKLISPRVKEPYRPAPEAPAPDASVRQPA
ncbi:hypothetical protein BJF92_17345 [Rhizobium rhizosphaerae]|uniref:Acyltransferase n=1 Tax=Xaviernesmea rhizosphaerae TaxID=1672749 RepID=A0A1Q9AIW3_9HYPH|nr:acyltransferase [Xaviernesmea rhizosphaerae]OLP55154.1 hypothetical protein BJF92_17345 [Xaviernesmea rhizosphaerae]